MVDDRVIALPLRRRNEYGVAPEFTEEGLALAFAFAEKYCDRFRWVEEWNSWMEWTGAHWRKAKTLVAYDIIRALCRDAAARVDLAARGGPRLAADLNTAKKRAAVQTMARSDVRFQALGEQWDADDWLLGTPAGIIDLRTGDNIGMDSERYVTRITTVAPGGECQTWLEFLDVVTKGDERLQAYLQRLFGYCLTGSTREHSLTFIYGPGGNGKGTALAVLAGILGDLHRAADVETFAERKHAAHSTELARLHNARVVTSQETEKGQHWAEARLKKLTGGDPITARFMRCDDFEFTPKFKLIIVGNHKPKFRSVDEAMRRRLHLIPFNHTVAKEDRDVNLGAKLKAEYSGILAWAIRGCMEWQQIGLDAPDSVLKATADYLDSEDMPGQWFKQRCKIDTHAKTSLKELFENWRHWADLMRVAPGDSRTLAAEVEKHLPFGSKRTVNGAARFVGVRLMSIDEIHAAIKEEETEEISPFSESR